MGGDAPVGFVFAAATVDRDRVPHLDQPWRDLAEPGLEPSKVALGDIHAPHAQHADIQCAPSILSTTGIVRSKIAKSFQIIHRLRYAVSSRMTSSKSVTRFRPLTCHGPVMP